MEVNVNVHDAEGWETGGSGSSAITSGGRNETTPSLKVPALEDSQLERLRKENGMLREKVKYFEEEYECQAGADEAADVDDSRVVKLQHDLDAARMELTEAQDAVKEAKASIESKGGSQVLDLLLPISEKLISEGKVPDEPATKPERLAAALQRCRKAEERSKAVTAEVEKAKKTWNHAWRQACRIERVADQILKELQRLFFSLQTKAGISTEQIMTLETRGEETKEGEVSSESPGSQSFKVLTRQELCDQARQRVTEAERAKLEATEAVREFETSLLTEYGVDSAVEIIRAEARSAKSLSPGSEALHLRELHRKEDAAERDLDEAKRHLEEVNAESGRLGSCLGRAQSILRICSARHLKRLGSAIESLSATRYPSPPPLEPDSPWEGSSDEEARSWHSALPSEPALSWRDSIDGSEEEGGEEEEGRCVQRPRREAVNAGNTRTRLVRRLSESPSPPPVPARIQRGRLEVIN